MSRSQVDLVQSMANGGNIELAAGGRNQQDLVQFAQHTKTRGAVRRWRRDSRLVGRR
jgi:hypothetical protein